MRDTSRPGRFTRALARAAPALALLVAALAPRQAFAASYTIVVTATPGSVSERSIGAVEGCTRFDVAELKDAGVTNYRIYAGTSRLETSDDDGDYGSPAIEAIKADPGVIPWAVWDAAFNRPDGYFWACPGTGAPVSLAEMLAELKANGIAPVLTLRNVDNNGNPPWAQAMNPPVTGADWNEWWQHVFAMVYWVNVRNELDVHDWQVHNEPDVPSQGWRGSLQDYIAFTRRTHDAIRYVYDQFLPGQTFRLHAPVSAGANDWIVDSLVQNDALLDVVDWHRYGNPAGEATMLHDWIDAYDSDGVHEDLYLSEWGSYRGEYTSLEKSLDYAAMLRAHSLAASQYVASSAIFPFYDWTSRMLGLVAADGTRRESFWAFRLMSRGLNGAKQGYALTSDVPPGVGVYAIAAKDQPGALYVEVFNRSAQPHTITLDLGAHRRRGSVTFREYSAQVKDAVTGTASLDEGRVTFALPASAIVQAILP
jgi:hypothetical protein